MDLGIHIYFEKENINTESMDSELMLSILSSLAESESVFLKTASGPLGKDLSGERINCLIHHMVMIM